jgi:C-5 cytosine-specific DNA methylase
MKPLCIDLYCGLGGWAEGFLAEGYRVVGFDIERHDYGTGGYPGQLVIQDVTTLHGSQFRNAAVIVASPPCQAYSYRAMPWSRAKALPPPDNTLFEACFRIQREACEAAGRYIPLIVENVRGAQKWVGQAQWHFGSYYLWGDVPALMPRTNPAEHVKQGGNWFHDSSPGTLRSFSGTKQSGISGPRNNGKSNRWFQDGAATFGSKSNSRKAASALIAKIPFPLANHIAKVFNPSSHCTPNAPQS